MLEKGDGNPVNVGDRGEMTILQFAQLVSKVTGHDVPVEHVEAMVDDPQRREPDITRARALGWEPLVPLEEGLARTLAWYRSRA